MGALAVTAARSVEQLATERCNGTEHNGCDGDEAGDRDQRARGSRCPSDRRLPPVVGGDHIGHDDREKRKPNCDCQNTGAYSFFGGRAPGRGGNDFRYAAMALRSAGDNLAVFNATSAMLEPTAS